MTEGNPQFDHNFLIAVQTDSAVPADQISRLLTAVDNEDIAAIITYVGTIDYAEKTLEGAVPLEG